MCGVAPEQMAENNRSAVVMMFATHSLAVAGVTGVITVVFTFTLMQAAISEYKKRHQELENAPEETDEQK